MATAYPSPEEFRTLLVRAPLGDLLREHILAGMPYAFRDSPHLLLLLKEHLCSTLPIEQRNVRIVGSGRTGFSLNPHNFPRRFSDESDLDVAVIDEKLFDVVWMTMLKWNYPRRRGLPAGEREWRNTRQNELYWGWFSPDAIGYEGLQFPEQLTQLRDLSARWFDAFQSVGTIPEFATRPVGGRLYRSWKHVLLYHLDGLRQLKELVEREEGG